MRSCSGLCFLIFLVFFIRQDITGMVEGMRSDEVR